MTHDFFCKAPWFPVEAQLDLRAGRWSDGCQRRANAASGGAHGDSIHRGIPSGSTADGNPLPMENSHHLHHLLGGRTTDRTQPHT